MSDQVAVYRVRAYRRLGCIVMRVIAAPAGYEWTIDHTEQSRRRDTALTHVRDWLTVVTDNSDDSIRLDVEWEDEQSPGRRIPEAEQSDYQRRARELYEVRLLSMRDVSVLLDVAYSTARQLVVDAGGTLRNSGGWAHDHARKWGLTPGSERRATREYVGRLRYTDKLHLTEIQQLAGLSSRPLNELLAEYDYDLTASDRRRILRAADKDPSANARTLAVALGIPYGLVYEVLTGE